MEDVQTSYMYSKLALMNVDHEELSQVTMVNIPFSSGSLNQNYVIMGPIVGRIV
jgi:hypothetical protein